MLIRVLVLLLLAAGVGYGTFHLVQRWLEQERVAAEARLRELEPRTVEQAQPEFAQVLVTTESLPVGRLIRPEDLRWQAWPDDNLSPSYVVRDRTGDPESFYGAVVREPIAQGQPITNFQVARPGERGFLAAVLGPGMRAATIPINPRTAAAGFIYPGDRVDVILTHQVQPVDVEGLPNLADLTDEENITFSVSETVLLDMRVLAIDQSLGAPQEGGAQVGGLATLEVTPHQAEMITVLQTSGSLSLSLRSLTDPAQPEAIALARELERPLPPGAEAEFFGATSSLSPVTGQTLTYAGEVSQTLLSPYEMLTGSGVAGGEPGSEAQVIQSPPASFINEDFNPGATLTGGTVNSQARNMP
ncbi:MAG: Flp pilus assembly protein CpaB [Rhodospirillaceae bacterium]|nr:Flp pilus assembly protein CpaB [Rhodospirillaceae bacterium]